MEYISWNIFGIILAMLSVTGSSDDVTVKVVLLVPYKEDKTTIVTKYLQRNKVRPVIDIAMNYVRKSGLLPRVKLILYEYDTNCSDALGPIAAFKAIMDHRANVFLGPMCEYVVSSVALYSPYWGVPVLTPGAQPSAFGDKKTYKLLTRMGVVYQHAGEWFSVIMAYHKWKNLGLVYHPRRASGSSNEYHICEAMFIPYQKARNQHLVTDKKFDDSKNGTQVAGILKELSLSTRVVVLCASPDSVRDIMLKAHELHFDNGEYVFINIDLFSNKNEMARPWYRKNSSDTENNAAKKAYEALMTVTLRTPTTDAYKKFSNDVKERAKKLYGEDFDYGEEEVNSFVGAFHDAVILYALALNETLEDNGNITDGISISRRMWNRTFQGITGDVSMDSNGDRNADYSLLDYNPDTDIFEVVAHYYGHRKKYEPAVGKKIHWAGGRTSAPPDEPECGFDRSKCPPKKPFPIYGIVTIVLSSLLVVVVVSAFFIYRHIKYQADLNEANWKVKWEDIMFGTINKTRSDMSGAASHGRRMSTNSSVHSTDTVAVIDAGNKQLFTSTAYYKGTLVAIKKLKRSSFNINQNALLEVKCMRDLQNDHICRFIGACTDVPNQCLIYEYCQKGSLQDVLENESIKLDWMFRYSLIQDLIRAMEYLHSSEVKSHGNLKSSNCLVDSRFVLKVSSFGLHSLRDEDDETDFNTFPYYQRKLWTSPELLRLHNRPPWGTQKGDVYSFAIICQEIICRDGVFFVKNMEISPQEIYEKVKNGSKPYFRPSLQESDCPKAELAGVVQRCWSEDPLERPDFHTLKANIRKLNKEGDRGNILDNLLNRMEQYANNLEALVEERTASYLEQKKKAEDLLYMMLPKKVAEQLVHGETVSAEAFDAVTIYFSDICGFTAMSAKSTPMQVIDLLNDLYSMFDKIIENFDVYKVETIGDAYMVVSGLPVPNGNLHAREICRMSLALLSAIFTFKIRHLPDEQLKLRIGLHSGPVCSGVVGHKMPRYCLFGDTVNTASRMESNGLPLKIHLSPDTEVILRSFKTFLVEPRGLIEMKGKGKISTYWLLGERQPTEEERMELMFKDDPPDYNSAVNHTDHIAVEITDHVGENTPLISTPNL